MMDYIDDLVDQINEEINNEIDNDESINEEPEEWFSNGIKKVGGSTLRFSEVEEITYDYLKVTRMGSTFDVDYSDVTDDTRLITLFISESKSRINMQMSGIGPYNITNNYVTNPLDTAYRYYSISDIDDASIGEVHRNNGTQIKLFKSNYNNTFEQFNTDIEFYAYNYGHLFSTKYYDDSGFIEPVEAYKNMCTLNQSVGNGKQGWYRPSSSGNGIKCTYYNNPVTEQIEIRPIMDGFGIPNGHGLGVIYETTVLGPVIGSIPYSLLNDLTYFNPEIDGAEPWEEGEDEGGVGTGTGIRTDNYPSDDIDFPTLPTVSALSTGFITAYNPDVAQMQELITYLWTSDWVTNLKKILNNPFDAVVSLQLLPYTISDIASPSVCKIGCINTEIPMDKVTNQYKILDCGNVTIPEAYGNALDYTNVRISIYLPFVGFRQLDTTLCMNSTIELKYYVDVLVGCAVALLKIKKSNTSQSVYYSFNCNLNSQVPITAVNYGYVLDYINKTVSGVTQMASKGVAIHGASGNNASMMQGINGINAVSGFTTGLEAAIQAQLQVPSVDECGDLSSNVGVLSSFTPYVTVELPIYVQPKTFGHDKGLKANISYSLSSLHGFTKIDSCHLDGIDCTDEEKNEIYSLLQQGVIL